MWELGFVVPPNHGMIVLRGRFLIFSVFIYFSAVILCLIREKAGIKLINIIFEGIV